MKCLLGAFSQFLRGSPWLQESRPGLEAVAEITDLIHKLEAERERLGRCGCDYTIITDF